MVISEFHQEFKILVDKTDSLNYTDFLPEEIDIYLNKAIEKFISQRAYGNNPRREGIEETQKRFDDLITLVTNYSLSTFTTTNAKPNGVIAALPSDYWHTLEEDVTISYPDCNNVTSTKVVPVIPVTHDKYNKIIRDPFNKPDNSKVVRMGLNGSMELISGTGVTITTYKLRYIRKPAVVSYGTTYSTVGTDTQCDLPVSTHKEIIAMAVQIALGTIEAKTYPVSVQENATIE